MTTTDTTTQTSSTTSDETLTSGLPRSLSAPVVAALEATWAAIQRRHPDLPDVVIVLASGSVGAPRGALKLGHFAAMRWTTTIAPTSRDGQDSSARSGLGEVFVGGEGLGLGPVDVMGTLLHEATHALAHARGVHDTSRQGRYHNRRFRDLATEIGLHVRQVPVLGWSDTHVPDTTVTEYAAELGALKAALTIHRRTEGTLTATVPGGEEPEGGSLTGTGGRGGMGGSGSRNGTAARCGCGRRIRVTASVLALGPITCGLCGNPFTEPRPAVPEPAVPADDADTQDDADDAAEADAEDSA